MKISNFVRLCTTLAFRVLFRNREVKTPVDADSVRKILVLRYDVIGDMVVTTPLLQFLKSRLPDAEIHVVGSKKNIGVLRCNPNVKKVYRYDYSVGSLLRIARECRKERYNLALAVVFHKTTKSGLWANLCGGKYAVKVTNLHVGRAKLYRSMFNVLIPLRPNSCTMAEALIQLASAALGVEYTKKDIEFFIPYDEHSALRAKELTDNIPENSRIFVNISAGVPERTWPVATWHSFLEQLHNSYPELHFFVSGSPDAAGDICRVTNELGEQFIPVPPSADILDTCAVVDRCFAVISPDTSIIHIASAYSKPTLGIYASAHFNTLFAPYFEPNLVVVSERGQPISEMPVGNVIQGFAQLWEIISK